LANPALKSAWPLPSSKENPEEERALSMYASGISTFPVL